MGRQSGIPVKGNGRNTTACTYWSYLTPNARSVCKSITFKNDEKVVYFNRSATFSAPVTQIILPGLSFKGNFKTWTEAFNKSIGFADPAIFEKVRASATLVKKGKAIYERDSVVFDKMQYAWPVLACLEHVVLANKKLHLVDFGGSLGTSYLQNRSFLRNLPSLKWYVVEQPHYVACGKNEFEDDYLKFEYTIEDVVKAQQINCLLVSGTLQCLEEATQWIEKFQEFNFNYIIVDRTSFIEAGTRLSIETVPKSIYTASFPCWFFNESDFLNRFSRKYELIASFDSSDKSTMSSDNKKMYWKGFFFKRKQ